MNPAGQGFFQNHLELPLAQAHYFGYRRLTIVEAPHLQFPYVSEGVIMIELRHAEAETETARGNRSRPARRRSSIYRLCRSLPSHARRRPNLNKSTSFNLALPFWTPDPFSICSTAILRSCELQRVAAFPSGSRFRPQGCSCCAAEKNPEGKSCLSSFPAHFLVVDGSAPAIGQTSGRWGR